MTVEFLRDHLISQGYKYLLLQAIESTPKGSTAFHYDLLEDFPALDSPEDVVRLSSHEGKEVIREFMQQVAKISLCRNGWCLNVSGIMYRNMIIEQLKF
jgi:hypothetical protein